MSEHRVANATATARFAVHPAVQAIEVRRAASTPELVTIPVNTAFVELFIPNADQVRAGMQVMVLSFIPR